MAIATLAEVDARVDAGARRQAAEGGAEQAAGGEAGVEPGEDRAPVAALDGDAVGVHRHVEGAVGGAHEEQQHAEHQQRRRQRHDPRPDRREDHRRGGGEAAAVPRGQRAGERHREHRADGDEEQRESLRAVGEVQPLADRGDPHRERAHQDAVEQERDGHRAARRRHGRTTSSPASR
jgi:hypothetical protein